MHNVARDGNTRRRYTTLRYMVHARRRHHHRRLVVVNVVVNVAVNVVVNVVVVSVVVIAALQCAACRAPVATGQSSFHRCEGEP